jgi:hypothetical protein
MEGGERMSGVEIHCVRSGVCNITPFVQGIVYYMEPGLDKIERYSERHIGRAGKC